VFTFTPGEKGLLKYKWAQARASLRGLHIFPLDKMEHYLPEAGFGQFEPTVYGSVLLFTARKV